MSPLTVRMESPITYRALHGAEMRDMPLQCEVGGHLQIWGRVQSREYTKKISEEQVEKRVAYEVSVSKIDVVEEEEA